MTKVTVITPVQSSEQPRKIFLKKWSAPFARLPWTLILCQVILLNECSNKENLHSPLASKRRIYAFFRTILVLFFGLLFLDIKSKFIGFCTKFYVRQAKFLPPKCTSGSSSAANQYSEITFTFSKIFQKTQCGV